MHNQTTPAANASDESIKKENNNVDATAPVPSEAMGVSDEFAPDANVSVSSASDSASGMGDATPAALAPPEPIAEEEDLEAQLAYENLKRRRESRKRKRILVIALVVVALLVGAIVFASRRAQEAATDDEFDPYAATASVYRGDFATTVSANGATEPLSSTIVTPEVDGIIEGVRVEEGAHVNAGDILFALKNEALDKAVRTASTQAESAQRAVSEANRAVDDAYAAYQREWNAHNEADDWEGFDEAGLKAQIASAESAYEAAKVEAEAARAALSEAQAEADKRTVRAPVAGSVVAMNAVNGAAVGGATGGTGSVSGPLIQISDLTQMKVTVQVNEVDIASISEGQQAKATFAALPEVELDATVQRIASVATGTGEGGYGGVVTYAVDLLIPNPDPKLKPGMTATVTITTQSAPDSLIAPSSAVWEGVDASGNDARYVTVLVDPEAGETRDVAVRVIEENNSEAAIEPVTEGDLAEGDLILLGVMGDMGDAGLMDEDMMYAGTEEF